MNKRSWSLQKLPKKMLLYYYLLILLQGLAFSNSAKLNAGLAFSESDKNGQIYVNLNWFLASRSADTYILNPISSLGIDIFNRYYAHCNQVSNLLTTYETNQTQSQMIQQVLKEVNTEIHDDVIVTPIKVSLVEAHGVCKSLGRHLPEIGTVGQKEFIRQGSSQCQDRITLQPNALWLTIHRCHASS